MAHTYMKCPLLVSDPSGRAAPGSARLRGRTESLALPSPCMRVVSGSVVRVQRGHFLTTVRAVQELTQARFTNTKLLSRRLNALLDDRKHVLWQKS